MCGGELTDRHAAFTAPLPVRHLPGLGLPQDRHSKEALVIGRLALLLCAAAVPALGQETVPATLAGHAALPAATFTVAPADAPADTRVSGKFLAPAARVDAPGTVSQSLGLPTPFEGQPVQGFSGFAAARAEDGSLFALIDNGFGSKLNSPDALLSFTRIAPDFGAGTVTVAERVWLRDPDRVVPFRIVHETTAERYLTGRRLRPRIDPDRGRHGLDRRGVRAVPDFGHAGRNHHRRPSDASRRGRDPLARSSRAGRRGGRGQGLHGAAVGRVRGNGAH
jgi:hypothetical protein